MQYIDMKDDVSQAQEPFTLEKGGGAGQLKPPPKQTQKRNED
jgi:hypothetical protein